MSNEILEVKGLKTVFTGKKGKVTAVDKISFSVEKGKCLCIVGESGCGKSVTSLSILRLIPKTTGTIEEGEILFDGVDILKLDEDGIRKIRGNKISMIFQDSMTGLNPVMTIGKQVIEAIKVHSPNIDKKELEKKALSILTDVGIPEPAKSMKEYPHQLSGGMRQRVMIAMALSAGNNELLIADEPTTALDVTIQAQILDLMRNIKKEFDTSILLIINASHTVKIKGYFSGLSCPSGTERIITFLDAPVSNSAGQTKFPTFSRIARSIPSVPSSLSPCLVISASR